MAVSVQSPEAAYRAITQTSAELTAAGETGVLQVREAVQKTEQDTGTRAEHLNTALEESTPLVKGGTQAIERNIGIETPDPVTGRKTRTPEETARFTSATEAEELARGYVEQGYDNCVRAEQDQLVEQADALLSADPLMEATLPPQGDPARRARVENFLRQKGAVTKVKAEYNKALAARERIKNDVSVADAEFKAAEAEEARIQAEIAKNRTDLTAVETGLDRFRPGHTDSLTLDKLTSANLEDGLEDSRDQVTELGRRIRNQIDLRDKTADPARQAQIQADIDTKEGERDAQKANIRKVGKQIATRNQLQATKDRLDAEKHRLEEQAPKLTRDLLETTKRRVVSQATLEQVSDQRALEEQKFVDAIEDIVRRGLRAHLQAEFSKADAARTNLAEEDIKKTTDQVDRAIKLEAHTRYRKGNRFHGRYDKKSPNLAYDLPNLTSLDPTKGPKDVLRTVTRVALARELTAVPPRFVLPPGKTLDQFIDERMADKDFVTKNQSVVAESLLAAAIDTHRITEEQFAIILSNDELGEGIINRARELNSNLDNQITVLRDQGIPINNGSVWEDLKKMDKKKAAGILTAIIAGVAVAVKGLIG